MIEYAREKLDHLELLEEQKKTSYINNRFVDEFFRSFDELHKDLSNFMIDLAVSYYDQQHMVYLLHRKDKNIKEKRSQASLFISSVKSIMKNILKYRCNGVRRQGQNQAN